MAAGFPSQKARALLAIFSPVFAATALYTFSLLWLYRS
jgi:hypothetical protein